MRSGGLKPPCARSRVEPLTVDLQADLILGKAVLTQQGDDPVIIGGIEQAVGQVEAVETGNSLSYHMQGKDRFLKRKGMGSGRPQFTDNAVNDDLEEDDLVLHTAHGGLVEVARFLAREPAGVETVCEGVRVTTRRTPTRLLGRGWVSRHLGDMISRAAK